MECPNCQSHNSMKWSGEFKSCVQCGYEDYKKQDIPAYKSKGLFYKAQYIGVDPTQTGTAIDVRVKKTNKESTARLNLEPTCPFDNYPMKKLMHITMGMSEGKYACSNRHTIWLYSNEQNNLQWD